MLDHGYTFAETRKISERAAWRVEDLIGPGKHLDFSRPFMPEALARTQALSFLSREEQILLNQIRGHSYLCIFGVVEEFILPFLLDHVRPRLEGAGEDVRAILQFASEEAKHIQLFQRFQEDFKAGFSTPCAVIGPASEIGKRILAHHPLSVGLAILGIEWMTQAHYIESIRDDQGLCSQFKNLLKHHWIEEAQHAKIDTLIVERMAQGCSAEERVRVIEDYLDIGGFIDGGLAQQTEFELEAFERASGRTLNAAEREQAFVSQRQASRYTYLGSGLIHPKFKEMLTHLGPELAERIASVAPAFC